MQPLTTYSIRQQRMGRKWICFFGIFQGPDRGNSTLSPRSAASFVLPPARAARGAEVWVSGPECCGWPVGKQLAFRPGGRLMGFGLAVPSVLVVRDMPSLPRVRLSVLVVAPQAARAWAPFDRQRMTFLWTCPCAPCTLIVSSFGQGPRINPNALQCGHRWGALLRLEASF